MAVILVSTLKWEEEENFIFFEECDIKGYLVDEHRIEAQTTDNPILSFLSNQGYSDTKMATAVSCETRKPSQETNVLLPIWPQ